MNKPVVRRYQLDENGERIDDGVIVPNTFSTHGPEMKRSSINRDIVNGIWYLEIEEADNSAERKKWVEEHNNSLPKETHYDSDGKEFSVAIDGIYDSEYMCYVYENRDIYGRITFKKLMKSLEQAPLLSLIKILKVEFYDNIDYYTPKNQRQVHLPDMKRPEIPLGERKKMLIDEIRDQIGRVNAEFRNVCTKITRKYFM
jgi:hypothetical protein